MARRKTRRRRRKTTPRRIGQRCITVETKSGRRTKRCYASEAKAKGAVLSALSQGHYVEVNRRHRTW